jgi:hypothetical protein
MFVVNDFRRDCAIRTGVRRAGTDDRWATQEAGPLKTTVGKL